MTLCAQVQKNAGYDPEHPVEAFPLMIFVWPLARPEAFEFRYAATIADAETVLAGIEAEAAGRGLRFEDVWIDGLRRGPRPAITAG